MYDFGVTMTFLFSGRAKEMEDILTDAFPKVVSEAYAACERALMDLYQHKAGHGC